MPDTASHERPYAGLKVVDLSQGIAGPYCAMLLAQYGADVIKVEPPEGDWARLLGRRVGDQSAFSVAGNLGKRSIVLDLKKPAAVDALWRLIGDADVFLEGFRPGVAARLGFGYEAVAARNPGIVYLSISGFGQTGPLSTKPAMDPVLQAFTGLMMQNKGQDGIPHRVGPIVVDMSTALYSFQAVAAALYARRDTGEGRRLEASLMQGATNLQVVRLLQSHLEGHAEVRAGAAPSGSFRCKGGGWLQILALKDRDVAAVAKALDLPVLMEDPRFASSETRYNHAPDINDIVARRLLDDTAEAWNAALTDAGVQNERLLDYAQFLAHPQVAATSLISWLPQPGVPDPMPIPNPPGTPHLTAGDPRAAAPGLGAQTAEVLREAGFDEAEIAAL